MLDEDLVVAIDPRLRPKQKARAKQLPLPMPFAFEEPKAKAPARKRPAPKPEPGAGGERPPLPPPSPPPVGPGGGVVPGPGGSSGSGGPCPVPVDEPPETSDSDAVVVARGPGDDRRKRPKRDLRWFDAVGGGRIRYDIYTPPVGAPYPNWTIECTTCPKRSGKQCLKTLGQTPQNSTRLGAIEAVALLHRWRTVPITDPSKTHRRHEPSEAEVDEYAAAHHDELEALVALATGEA